ncbi:ATP-dependent protease, partial [Lysobacter lacus]
RARVERARALQTARCGAPNARLTPSQTFALCRLEPRDQSLLEQAVERLQLSARSMVRILRTARTIADLAGEPDIGTAHLAEAIGYRALDRQRESEPAGVT